LQGNPHSSANINFTQNVFQGEFVPPQILKELDDNDKEWVKGLTEKEQEARHAWAHKEQDNRREYELHHLSALRWLSHSGQICTTIVALSGIAGGVFLLNSEKSIAGYSLSIGSIGVIILAGFFGKPAKSDDKPKGSA
jgi:uncharacterized membrane protein